MAASNETSQARLRRMERQAHALELRRMGKGYTEIAQIVGISKSQAHRLVQMGLADARAQVDAQADELKAEEISRLDAMLAGLWPLARKGVVGAVDRVIKIMERRAKLLGLDAPVRLAHGGDQHAPPIQHAHEFTDDALAAIAATGRG